MTNIELAAISRMRHYSIVKEQTPPNKSKIIHLWCKSNGVMILRRKPHAQAWRIGILGKGRGLAAGVSMGPMFPQGLTR